MEQFLLHFSVPQVRAVYDSVLNSGVPEAARCQGFRRDAERLTGSIHQVIDGKRIKIIDAKATN
jgi:hypothetical protein